MPDFNKKGMLSLVLHAHLPFVRHPQYQNFLEENWLYEAISETYLPLLRVFDRLAADNVPFRTTLSISPTLAAMLVDPLLQERYEAKLNLALELAEKEVGRLGGDDFQLRNAEMYRALYRRNKEDFCEKYGRNLLNGFKKYRDVGQLELITTVATHAFLPGYLDYPQALRAQIQTALEAHDAIFREMPEGIWLPECGYYPGIEDSLRPYGINYFISSAHGILYADDKPEYGVYAPLRCPNGVHAFGRDRAAAKAVWSAEEGFPGDPVYRDFYRDIGYDLPLDYISPYIGNDNLRVNTGFKYHAITGDTDDKNIYDPHLAYLKSQEHAAFFVENRVRQCETINPLMDKAPVIVCPFDAELFGHWWYEGPNFLEGLFREIAKRDEVSLATPSDYLKYYPHNQMARPAYSSWGDKGYGQVWIDGKNDWVYRHTHKLIERMSELVERFPDEKGLKERTLNQAAREVLLSQASDWPFIMKTGTTVPYATKRIKEHVSNFNYIYDSLCRNTVKTEWLTKLEKKNNLFPNIDYRIFKIK